MPNRRIFIAGGAALPVLASAALAQPQAPAPGRSGTPAPAPAAPAPGAAPARAGAGRAPAQPLPVRNGHISPGTTTAGINWPAIMPPDERWMAGQPVYELDAKPVRIWSEGSRLSATIYRPRGLNGDLPAVLLSHGWGGTKADLDKFARGIASKGFVTLVYDYRTWGDSDGKIIPMNDSPMLTTVGETTMKVRVIREVVDPLDHVADARACLAYLMTERGVDPDRVGMFGTSYGCGHTTNIAATDSRVRAVYVQVGSYGQARPGDIILRNMPDWFGWAEKREADKARGLIDPPIPQNRLDQQGGGSADMARARLNDARGMAHRIRCPMMFMDAIRETLVNPEEHGIATYNIVRQNAIAERCTFDGTHYDIYNSHYLASVDRAGAWFKRWL